MKIRNGFVSNSSSSSFCIYGAYVPFNSSLNNIFKLLKKIQEVKPEEYKKWMDSDFKRENITREMYEFLLNISEKTKKEFMLLEGNKGEDEDEIASEWQDYMIDILESMGLYACYVDDLYIGRCYQNIGDSETGKQFKDSTQEIITKLFNKKCEHIEEIIND